MATPQKADSITILAREIVAGDEDMQVLLKGLIKESVKHALYTMAHGNSSDKAAMMKMLTPHMLEGLRQNSAAEADRAAREAYERIMGELRGHFGQTMGEADNV